MTHTDEEILELWKEKQSSDDLTIVHKLILHYIWLVRYVLKQMNLPSNSLLSEEDFLNIGILGLNEAINRYDLERGVKFESYAIPRVRGIIQDELRKLDWLSRTARKKATDYLHAGDELRSSEGREVSAEEIRMKLNVTTEQYQTYLAAAAAAKASLSLNESYHIHLDYNEEETDYLEEIPDKSQKSTLEVIENEERVDFLMKYLEDLTERKRLVMTLYYYEELTFKEIGQVLNVSESRVCQIHTQILSNLRKKINEFEDA